MLKKKIEYRAVIVFFLCAFAFEDGKAQQETPEQLVQRQLDAYNKRDIDAFMETYSDSVKLFQFPNRLTTKGKEQMRMGYKSFFEANPNLNCEIKNRIVQGNIVIDQERVTGLQNGAIIEATAIYVVEKGKIKEVYLFDKSHLNGL
jgi:hypothetical protein